LIHNNQIEGKSVKPFTGGTLSKRDEFIAKLKTKLDEWNADLAELETKAQKAGTGLKQKYEKQIVELRAERDQAATKLQQVQDAGEEAWDSIKDGMENAWVSLKKAFVKKDTTDV
jgi:DNA repair ATPase RecN